MKKVFVLIDGLGDRKNKSLGNKTPLEFAETPNLDFFSMSGANGRVMPLKKGLAPESDVAIMALLGFDVFRQYTGRGPLEALGAGIKIRKGWLALRGNFATARENKLIDRRVGRTLSTREAIMLEKEINRKVKLKENFVFRHTIEHRNILVIKARNLSNKITNTDPYYKRVFGFGVAVKKPEDRLVACKAMDESADARHSAELINDFSRQARKVLEESPVNKARDRKHLLKANHILLRDAGTMLPKHAGLKGWAAIVGMPLEIGIARAKGMKVLSFEYPEKKADESVYDNLFRKTRAEIANAKKLLETNWNKFNSFYIHFKEVDVMGHDGNLKEKTRMIELIDREFFSWFRKRIDLGKDRVLVTADHSTPCILKRHSDDPVPLLVAGKGVRKDHEKKFSEFNSGSLGTLYGRKVIQLFNKKVIG